MRKIIFLFVISVIAFGCVPGKSEKPAIKIGNILITPAEFEEAFEMSRFYGMGEAGKRAFLETFISRKLILREAEKMGFDKDPVFLRDIQLFWEQALLKLAISRQMKELSLDIRITDSQIRDYFAANQEGFGDKDMAEVYHQIKWILLQDKQQKAIAGWVNSLRQDTEVVIDYDILGLDE